MKDEITTESRRGHGEILRKGGCLKDAETYRFSPRGAEVRNVISEDVASAEELARSLSGRKSRMSTDAETGPHQRNARAL